MKIIFLVLLTLLSNGLNAKVPENSKLYKCSNNLMNPSILHQTRTGSVLGICGQSDLKSKFLFSNFELLTYNEAHQPNILFKSEFTDAKILTIATESGLLLIESYNDKKTSQELIKRTVVCISNKVCQIGKEICLVPKAKSKRLLSLIKDKNRINQLKKIGCI
jgi:hypothetical protein